MDLYPHNQSAYDALVEMLETRSRACVIQPCGTGKAMIGFHYAQEHPDERILWLSPNEYVFGEQGENLKHEGGGDTPRNVEFMTYAAAMLGARAKTLGSCADTIILDEFHRAGAPEWSKGVEELIAQNPDAKIIGFTATEVRYKDGGRNMADELFDGNVASYMSLEEAWLMGILPIPKYVTALYDAPEELGHILARIERISDERRYSAFMSKYEKLRRAVLEASNLDAIFARHVERPDAKLIVFCLGNEHLEEIALLRDEWFGGVNPEIHAYKTYEGNPRGQADYRAFKEDDSDALKVLYCINQLNEGVHIKDVDGIVMVRPTGSPIVFKQQLGRALDVGGNRVPLVFDLVNNLGSAGGYAAYGASLETEYQGLVRRGKQPPYTPKSFAVYDEIQDPRDFLDEVRTAVDVRMPIEEKIERLEAMHASGAAYEKIKGVVNSLRNDFRNGRLTEEDVRRIEEAGVTVSPRQIARKRAVVCYETGEVFESVAEAARAVGVANHNNLFKACKEKGMAGGYHWYYADDPRPEPHELKAQQIRPVLCVETGEVFDSARVAAQSLGISASGISQALRTGGRAGGYHWRYADSDVELPWKKEHKNNKHVVCYETGEVFENAAAVAQRFSASLASVRSAIYKGHATCGYHWYYEDDPRPDPAKLKKHERRMVLCVETGEMFESCAAAAKSLGLTKNTIINIIGQKGRTAGGYHWRYADSDAESLWEKQQEPSKRVVCYETGELFENVAAVSEFISVSPKTVQSAIRLGSASGGCHWYYENGPKPDPTKFGKHKHRAVVCVETGEMFESCAAAAKSLGLTKSAVINIVDQAGKTAGGYHWRYATEEEILRAIPRRDGAPTP